MMVVQYVLEDHTWRETSEKFGISCTPIEKWVNLYKLHGTEGLLSRNLVGRQKKGDILNPLYIIIIFYLNTTKDKGGKKDAYYIPNQSYQRFEELWIPYQ